MIPDLQEIIGQPWRGAWRKFWRARRSLKTPETRFSAWESRSVCILSPPWNISRTSSQFRQAYKSKTSDSS